MIWVQVADEPPICCTRVDLHMHLGILVVKDDQTGMSKQFNLIHGRIRVAETLADLVKEGP